MENAFDNNFICWEVLLNLTISTYRTGPFYDTINCRYYFITRKILVDLTYNGYIFKS